MVFYRSCLLLNVRRYQTKHFTQIIYKLGVNFTRKTTTNALNQYVEKLNIVLKTFKKTKNIG